MCAENAELKLTLGDELTSRLRMEGESASLAS
jgi:hypothetical protein